VRRHEKEIINKDEIEEILEREIVCRIGLSEDNMPYVFPVNYAFSDGCLYFHTANIGKKMDMMRKNNNVCFEVDTVHALIRSDIVCNWGVKYESIIGFGKAIIVEDNDQKIKALNIIMKHHDKDNRGQEIVYDYNEAMVKRVTVIKIEVSEMTGKKG